MKNSRGRGKMGRGERRKGGAEGESEVWQFLGKLLKAGEGGSRNKTAETGKPRPDESRGPVG